MSALLSFTDRELWLLVQATWRMRQVVREEEPIEPQDVQAFDELYLRLLGEHRQRVEEFIQRHDGDNK
jgi:hypothetical protein